MVYAFLYSYFKSIHAQITSNLFNSYVIIESITSLSLQQDYDSLFGPHAMDYIKIETVGYGTTHILDIKYKLNKLNESCKSLHVFVLFNHVFIKNKRY